MSAAAPTVVPKFGRAILDTHRTSEKACRALLGDALIAALAHQHFKDTVDKWPLYLKEVNHPPTGVYLVSPSVTTAGGKKGYDSITIVIIRSIPAALHAIFAKKDFDSTRPTTFACTMGAKPESAKVIDALQKHAAFARLLAQLEQDVKTSKEEQKEPSVKPEVRKKAPPPKPFVPSADLLKQYAELEKAHSA